MADQPTPDHIAQFLTWSNAVLVGAAGGIGGVITALITKRGDRAVKEVETAPQVQEVWSKSVADLIGRLQEERDRSDARAEELERRIDEFARNMGIKVDRLESQNRALLDKLDAVLRHMTLLEEIIRKLGGSPPERPHAVRSKKHAPETDHEAR